MEDGKIYVEKIYDKHGNELDKDTVDAVKMLTNWKEILIDETSTKSVMVFRKDIFGDISMETITRINGKLKSYVAEEQIFQETVDDILRLCNQRGYEIHITLE
jgi:hypothetical protein